MGRSGGFSTNHWDAKLAGRLDEISLYNRALSATEIATLYNAGTNHVGKCQLPPAIITQPASQTNNMGGTVTFMVAATGSPRLSCQWYFNGTNVMSGATNISLTLTNVQATNAGNYLVVVANMAGSVPSSNAVLKVNVPPLITQQPVNVTTNAGGNATFSVTVSNISTLPLSYQWYFNPGGLTNLLTNATSATLSLTNVQLNQAGTYWVVVTNMAGSATSSNAVLAVNNLAFSVQIIFPTNQTLLARSNVIISATATNSTPGVTNQWVEFFANATNSLGYVVATNGLYQLNWAPPVGGTNILTALVMDSRGSNAWSIPVTNYVRGLPAVTITNPANGQIFPVYPTNITITATAVADRSTITNVAFYQGTHFIAAATNGPTYQVSWTVVTNGTYTLTAKGTDSNGVSGVSFPVTNTVEPANQPPVVYAGPNQTTNLPAPVQLTGFVSDDGLPSNTLAIAWTLLSGPTNGTVTFSPSNQPGTTATINTNGTYILQLAASDGQYTSTSAVTIVVLVSNSPPYVNAGTNQTFILPALILPALPTYFNQTFVPVPLPNTNTFSTIQLVPIATGLNTPVGLDYFPASNSIIVSVNNAFSFGSPYNFELVSSTGATNQFSSISNLNSVVYNPYDIDEEPIGGEVHIATVRDTLGGFSVGEMFCGNNQTGQVMRIEPDGTTIGTNVWQDQGQNWHTNAWLVLSNNEIGIEPGVVSSLWVDDTGVWGGNLIVTTDSTFNNAVTNGCDIWRINSAGQAALVARILGIYDTFDAVTTVPNDSQKYGPWAGRILVGTEFVGTLFAIDTNGLVVPFTFPFGAGDIKVIPPNQNFFGVDGNQTVWGAPASEFQGMVGDILIAAEDWGILYRVHWNGNSFDTYNEGQNPTVYWNPIVYWEQINFAPFGSTNLPAPVNVQLGGVVIDDGRLFSPTTNLWVEVSGPGPVTFANPAQTNTTASFTLPGDYVLRLTAYDGEFTSYSNVTIQVIQNQAPVVSAGTNQVISNFNTTLYGSVSDDGWPSNQLTLTWSMVSSSPGDTVTFNPTNQVTNGIYAVVTNNVTFSDPGTYVLCLTASDGQATSSAYVTVNVLYDALTVTPAYGWPTRTNVPYTLTIRSVDANDNPITNQTLYITADDGNNFIPPVQLSVSANSFGGYSTNDANGYASFTYSNTSPIIGRDYIKVWNGQSTPVYVIKDWALDIGCGQTISHSYTGDTGDQDSVGCLSLDWPADNPHFADFYLYAGTAGTPITLSYVRTDGILSTEALVLRDPSNNVVAVSENGLLNYTLPLSGDYLIEVVELAYYRLISNDSVIPQFTPTYTLSLVCNGCPLNQPNNLQVLYNGTNVPNYGMIVFPYSLGATNISLTISNAGANTVSDLEAVLQNIGVWIDYKHFGFFFADPNQSSQTLIIPNQCSTNLFISYDPELSGPPFGSLCLSSGAESWNFYVNLIGNTNNGPTCAPPSIQLVSPPNGTVFYANNTNDTVPINITAAATPVSTNMNYVVWTEDYYSDSVDPASYYDSTPVATNLNSVVYATVWYLNVGFGDHLITATAVDQADQSAMAAPVTIHVGNAPPVMQVLCNGTNVPNNATVAFPLTAANVPVEISLVITNPGAVAIQTTEVTTNTPFINGVFALLNDVSSNTVYSGCATNLNISFNPPSNGVTYGTLILGARGLNGGCFTINLAGTASPTGAPPVIQMVSPANGSSFYDTTPLMLSAVVTSAITNISCVTFQALTPNGPVALGQSTNSPYILHFANVPDGDYTLTAVAVDAAGRSGTASPVTIHIVPANGTNQLPVAVDDKFTVRANSQNNILNPLANDSNPGNSPLTIVSLQPPATTNHGTATIVDNGTRISYTPAPNLRSVITNGVIYPADGFSYQISDGKGGTSWGGVLINVFAPDMPQVTLTNYPSATNAGALVPLIAYVTPSQYITNVAFFLGQTLIGQVTNGVNGFYTNNWTANYDACDCGFTAQATDVFGQVNTSPEIYINVTLPTNAVSPVAALDSYTGSNDSGTLTNGVTIRDGIIELYGQAYQAQGSNVVWQLGVYTADGSTLLRNVASGSNSVTSANTPFAACDLSTLINGVYDLRLTVSGDYQTTNNDVQFLLETSLKIGQFSFSQQDLVIPVNGIPLTVTRTYNSINPNKGDFGYGWTYALNDMNASIDEQRNNTIDADGEPFSERTGGSWDVTLTLPNGQITTFYFNLSPVGGDGTLQAQWLPAPGVTASLEAQPNGYTYTMETIFDSIAGNSGLDYWDGTEQGMPIAAFDFRGFILKTQDGTQYYINREDLGEHFMERGEDGYTVHAWGNLYLSQIVEPSNTNSNDTITINPNSIVHAYANGATNQIVFQRNSDGLITSISDPDSLASNGPPAVQYQYDANDNLINVLNLVNRSGSGTYVTNSFAYTNAGFPHYITGVINANGTQVAENFYDNSGKLTAVQDANGNLTKFIHNLTNSMEVVIDRLGNTNTYVYDTYGNVIAQTNALGQVTTMAYDINNNKTNSIVYFINGQPYATNSYVYDLNLNVMLASTDPLGNTNGFTYNGNGQLCTNSDARGNMTVNTYDSGNNLISTTDALGHGTTNSYSGSLLTGSCDAIGTITTNSYDPATDYLIGTATLNASGTILSSNTFAYDANGNRTSSTVWRRVGVTWVPAVTTYIYDAMNRVVQTIDPDGGTNTVVYAPTGKQQAAIDQLGRTTSYIYDLQSRLIQTTYPDQTTETSAYDANGNRTNSVDRLNRVTSYYYDALNRLTNTTYPDNTTSTTVYDGFGRVAQTIDARGTITAFSYDVAGRRLAVTNAFGVSGVAMTNFYGYDPNGNQTTFTDSLGHTTTNVFDALNRQVQAQFPDGTTTGTAYDADGRRVADTNQDKIVTQFGYDGAGRLISVTNAVNTAQQMVTRYQYDEAGNQTAQIDALNRTNVYLYDGLGRRIQHAMPGGQNESFAYDLAGNLIYQINFNGAVITNQYDVMNRLTNRASVNGYQVSYIYSPTGQRATMTDPSGTTTCLYDNRDRLTNKVVNWGSPAQLSVALNYSYDANGNLVNLWSSTANGVTNVYQYDALNRLTNVVGQASSLSQYSYDLAGNLQTMRYGNGVTNLCQYDSLNRLTNSVWKLNAGTLASFYYQLGLTGNRTNVIESVNNSARTNIWNYDALYRLTSETIGGASYTSPQSLGYGYDPVGNRTIRTNITGSLNLTNQAFAFNPNDWLTGDQYDNNGNTTNSSGSFYQYDVMNHVINVNNDTILITYDGDGNRVSKTIAATGTTTYYLLDDRNPSGFVQVLEEYQSLNSQPSTLNRLYNYGLSLVSQKQGGTTYYFICDGHGSTRALYDSGGAFVNAFAYDAYGNLIASNGVPQTAYLYCGQQWDTDLGSYYLRARTYNPGTGRFPTADSYAGNNEDPLSLHKYLYAQDNPVDNDDPSGNDIGEMVDVMDMQGMLAQIGAPVATKFGAQVSQVLVDVHFDLLGSAFGRKYDHAYILLHGQAGGVTYIFRGGPSAHGGGNSSGASKDFSGSVPKGKNLGWGYLTDSGSGRIFDSSSPDFPNGPNSDVAHFDVDPGTKSFAELYMGFMQVAEHIESLHLPYHPVRQNSNSFVKTELVKNGLSAPRRPPVWAPGWNHILY